MLQIENGDGADDGAVDISEPPDGHHHDELEAEHDHEVLGAEKLRVEREETPRQTLLMFLSATFDAAARVAHLVYFGSDYEEAGGDTAAGLTSSPWPSRDWRHWSPMARREERC